MSLAWPVNENGMPVIVDASHATVVQPCAKWAWMWVTSPAASSSLVSSQACSSSFT